MPKDKRSFFEKLTGSVEVEDDEELEEEYEDEEYEEDEEEEDEDESEKNTREEVVEEQPTEGRLPIDMYQTPDEIIIKSVIGGVRPEELDISITRDMITIQGKREESKKINEENYYHQELYWGSFARSIELPQEIEVDEAEASEKNGMLFLRLPKVNKERQTKLKVKSS